MDFQQMIPENVVTTSSGRKKRKPPLSADKRKRLIADWRASGKSGVVQKQATQGYIFDPANIP